MRGLGTFLVAPLLGLPTWRGLVALFLSFVLANRINPLWRGEALWWLPLVLFWVIQWVLLGLWYRKASHRSTTPHT
ncbi:hypothetical protein H8D30_00400 [bacterium]|nr:hypothetical protein [bacterium]